MTTVWDPITVGTMTLDHRFVMAPMTRSRAHEDGTPGDLAADYYAQRASMGLIISEGTQPSADGQGYLKTPGIYTDDHVRGWKTIAAAVDLMGGHLFIQLMHVGRISHPDNTPHHRQPVAPSAIGADQPMVTRDGIQRTVVPRALSLEEIGTTVDDFRRAAAMAVEAGADGVEIHGANGYLVHQFLAPNANLRTDRYGGSIENRARFAVEVATAVAREIGADRTGFRISPSATLGGLVEGPEGPDLYRYLVSELDAIGLAYLSMMHFGDEQLLADLRKIWSRPLLLLRMGRTIENVADDVISGLADMLPIGRWALANPDFVDRYRLGAGLNVAHPETFYTGGARGYIDYPFLELPVRKRD